MTWVGYTPAPENYRIFTGVYEVACSLSMLISSNLKTVATGIQATISGGAVFTHLALKDNTSAIPPSVMAVLLLFLFIRSCLSSCDSTDKPSKFKIPKKLKVKWCVIQDSTSFTALILGTIYNIICTTSSYIYMCIKYLQRAPNLYLAVRIIFHRTWCVQYKCQ